MGDLPIHIYGYNNEHDVIVYTVVNDTQSEYGQPPSFSKVSILVRLHWNTTLEFSN